MTTRCRPIFASALVLLATLAACVTAPPFALGGADVLDLADPSSGASWEWQATGFEPDGGVRAPDPAAFLPLPHDEIVAPRGGPGLSAVWYRVRFPSPPGAGDRPLLVAVSVDDYGEIVVGGDVLATAAGFNGVLVAELSPAPRHELLVLGVNSPLGRPPRWPVWRNEVFVRRPVRVVAGGTHPRVVEESATRGGRSESPIASCAVRIQASELAPLIDDLARDDASECTPPAGTGPRWLRYRLEGPATIEVAADGYAEIWVDGGIDLSFGDDGRAPMSTMGRVQRAELPPGSHRVDVLAWPGPFARPAREARVSLSLDRH